VVERPWTAQRGFGRQFGILAHPDGRNDRPALGLLLLNAGAVRHTGPNRMWVEVARRWAARGVPVLRLDIEGLGDSDGDGRPYVDSARLYEPGLAVQAEQAVADLVAAGVADRWLVVGLCAGASWAFHAARADKARIAAAVLMNPFAFDWEDELARERDVGRTRELLRSDGWRRLLSGDVSGERIRGVAAHALRTPLERGQRRRRMNTRVRREQADLDKLRDSATQLTLLIGRDEPILDRFEREGILDQLDRWPNVVLRRLPTRDHTFRAPWLQAYVHAELDAAVAAELHRADLEATRARGEPAARA
jgi:pimeloyl-ACP methyl ester carboxylesterase